MACASWNHGHVEQDTGGKKNGEFRIRPQHAKRVIFMPNDDGDDGGKLNLRQPSKEKYTDPKNEKGNKLEHILIVL